MLLILIAVNAIFFGIGYFSTDTVFNDSYYYYSASRDLGLLYFVSILVGILLLVGWLVYYSRNNGFKTFYPKKTYQLYLEWLLIFVITIGISLIPFTLTEGYATKWRAVASLNEVSKAIETLNKVEILIPVHKDDFRYNSAYDKPISIPENMSFSADTLDLNLYDTEYSHKDGIIIKGYIGPSLLFGKDNYYYSYYKSGNLDYIDQEELLKIKHQEQVRRWLQTGQKDSLFAVMKDFEKLQKKYGFKINITPEQWIERIYKPPFFAVTNSSLINRYEPDNYSAYNYPSGEVAIIDSYQYTNDYDIPPQLLPFLQYNELNAGYEQVYRHYKYNNDTEIIILICLCVALALSVFIYTFRITGGKQWLIAFVSTGILIFIVVLIGVAMIQSAGYKSEEVVVMILMLFWIVLFIALLARVINKILEKSSKGYSNIYMNILVWLVPCLIPLLFLTVVIHAEYVNDNYFNPSEEDIMCMFRLNILATTIAMWFVSVLARKWKSIADE